MSHMSIMYLDHKHALCLPCYSLPAPPTPAIWELPTPFSTSPMRPPFLSLPTPCPRLFTFLFWLLTLWDQLVLSAGMSAHLDLILSCCKSISTNDHIVFQSQHFTAPPHPPVLMFTLPLFHNPLWALWEWRLTEMSRWLGLSVSVILSTVTS